MSGYRVAVGILAFTLMVTSVACMLLASVALGYGACWLEGYTLPREEEFKELLGIPKSKRLITLVPVGVPAENPVVDKKPLDEILHWERY